MTVTNFIWDELSDNVLLETDENDVVTAAYHNRPEQFGELLSQNRSGADRFFHFDGNHSTSDLTASNEKVTDTFSFTAYGEEVARTGKTTNPFGYKGAVGYYTNETTNDIYVRNRSYNPATGRWLSKMGSPDKPIIIIERDSEDFSGNCCKKIFAKWKYKLNQKINRTGYFIQVVKHRCDYKETCCGPIMSKTIEYWEAFKVNKDSDRFRDTDDAWSPANCDKHGKIIYPYWAVTQTAVVKFFYFDSHETTRPNPLFDPDFPDDPFNPPTLPDGGVGRDINKWKKGTIKKSPCKVTVGPRATTDLPIWWAKKDDGQNWESRSFWAEYKCCRGENRSYGGANP